MFAKTRSPQVVSRRIVFILSDRHTSGSRKIRVQCRPGSLLSRAAQLAVDSVVVVLRLDAVDRLRAARLGRSADDASSVWRELDASEPLEHAVGLVDDGAHCGRLGALGIELILHEGDELLARLVRAVFVEDVVEIEEERAQVLHFLAALGDEEEEEALVSLFRLLGGASDRAERAIIPVPGQCP